jgi:hypothetical protein
MGCSSNSRVGFGLIDQGEIRDQMQLFHVCLGADQQGRGKEKETHGCLKGYCKKRGRKYTVQRRDDNDGIERSLFSMQHHSVENSVDRGTSPTVVSWIQQRITREHERKSVRKRSFEDFG